jgi:transcriptional regulator with XRE-family HTH domain
VQSGKIQDIGDVCIEYKHPSHNIHRLLISMTNRELQGVTGLARSTIQRLRNGKQRPRRKTVATLAGIEGMFSNPLSRKGGVDL